MQDHMILKNLRVRKIGTTQIKLISPYTDHDVN